MAVKRTGLNVGRGLESLIPRSKKVPQAENEEAVSRAEEKEMISVPSGKDQKKKQTDKPVKQTSERKKQEKKQENKRKQEKKQENTGNIDIKRGETAANDADGQKTLVKSGKHGKTGASARKSIKADQKIAVEISGPAPAETEHSVPAYEPAPAETEYSVPAHEPAPAEMEYAAPVYNPDFEDKGSAPRAYVRETEDTKEQEDISAVTSLRLSQIVPNKDQPRKDFDETALQELADSIRQHGILQPLLVQKKGDFYEIVAGERRWRAARMAKLKEVPVLIRKFTPDQRQAISLIENLQREDLNPIEEANAYRRLIEEFDLTQEELAEKLSRSRTAITNAMRLLKLDMRVQQLVIEGKLSQGHARTIIPIEDPDRQFETAVLVINAGLSVRETEKAVKRILEGKPERTEPDPGREQIDAIYHGLEERLKGITGTKVTIRHNGKNKGKIELEFFSGDELERLMGLFEQIRQGGMS